MSFYILTFKKKVYITLFLVFLALVLIDIFLSIGIDLKTNKNYWFDKKISKAKHYFLNNSNVDDIVFIGSSRTLLQVSTNIFKKEGLNIYNFGIAGSVLSDYPTIVNNILLNNNKPKYVIISISINNLYSELANSKFPTLEDIKTLSSIGDSKYLTLLKRWFINQHTFLVYSEPIYLRCKSFYKRFGNKKIDKISFKPMVKLPNTDCNVFHVNSSKNRSVLKCTNGDAILVGNHLTKSQKEMEYLKKINMMSAKLLNYLIFNLNKNNVDVLLILEPVYKNIYKYDITDIYKKFNKQEILDLTNLKFPDNFWADNGHLNYLGRKAYSLELIRRLKSKHIIN